MFITVVMHLPIMLARFLQMSVKFVFIFFPKK